VFGISFTEMLVVALVALIVVGPQKLPKMLRTLGEWIAKVRRITSEVRAQTGIDDILRAEGLTGGLNELRSMMRGDFGRGHVHPPEPVRVSNDPYADLASDDTTREYPLEGADAYGALPDDLMGEGKPPPPLAGALGSSDKPTPAV
jgi:sec-independent protein translocase protein TatB